MSSNTHVETTARLLTSLVATFGVYGLVKLFKFFYWRSTSPIRRYLGPPSQSFVVGNSVQVWGEVPDKMTLHKKWVEEYGRTFAFHGVLGNRALFTTDLKALNHILMNSYNYRKPPSSSYNLSRILGEGVIVVEEDKHKQQRRIMNPAFGAAQIRELTEIFVNKSIELRDSWAAVFPSDGEAITLDPSAWLNRTTLDIIGLAGFNHQLNTLRDGEDESELSVAFTKLTSSNAISMTLIPFLRGMFPWLRWLPHQTDGAVKAARQTMDRIGLGLLRDSKESLRKEGHQKDGAKGKDLLTLLLRANTSTDIPEHQRMTEAEVLAQVPTFLVAGHDTTSAGTTWALYALCNHPKVQTKLRDELLTVSTDNPTMDELNALPYFDAVVRECLRLHSPVMSSTRTATKNDVLPLSKPIIDKDGNVFDSIPIREGQAIFIPILYINRDKSIWGEDAEEFKPERWESVPEAASAIPGVWSNMLTFLGGPRACIGYRFTIVEMKAILFTLLRKFEFELAVPDEDIGRRWSMVVQRPYLLSQPDVSYQMPLKAKLYTGEQ